MYKIGMIGDKDSVLGFMAAGFSVHITEDGEEAKKILRELAEKEYAVIYITEELALKMTDDIDRYKDAPLPAVIVIPGKKGSSGFGMANIKKSVERAVGADILFKD